MVKSFIPLFLLSLSVEIAYSGASGGFLFRVVEFACHRCLGNAPVAAGLSVLSESAIPAAIRRQGRTGFRFLPSGKAFQGIKVRIPRVRCILSDIK
ncbi:hypothetical protein [Xaviernesmea oryzae]|uniref:hypothetical protein n=1 Tax=Rhizobium/Agrobacterium group TaxID=227290 RepID=UPI00117A5EAE|nr:hypothetical protein [Xaviernesmea oryzae]